MGVTPGCLELHLMRIGVSIMLNHELYGDQPRITDKIRERRLQATALGATIYSTGYSTGTPSIE